MDTLIRLSAIVNKVKTANPTACYDEIKQVLSKLPEYECDIAVLPKLALCSPGCGSLFTSPSLLAQCEDALDALRELTKTRNTYFLVGTVVEDWGKTVSAMAVLYRGELVALVPTVDNGAPIANAGFSEDFLPATTVFACGGLRFCILGCALDNMAVNCAKLAQTGCDLIIIPAYDPVSAGSISDIRRTARILSKSLGVAIAIVNGGTGDTSSPYAYRGFAAVYECGDILGEALADDVSIHFTVDLDADIIHAMKKASNYVQPRLTVRPQDAKPGLLRRVRRNPFLPEDNPGRYLEDLFLLQSRSLASRMANTGIEKLVLGVSGGLDSTAALLASVKAMDLLGFPRENIIGVTMPGFGTSDHTYGNALALLDKTRVTRREISIKAAVEQHFKDIGHTGDKDAAYENAQARERAQVLLDLANMVGGLVVGTGDLSEEALGFCTFSGDHIANYNVNVCITKTMLRDLVGYIAEKELIDGVSATLMDILDTPVSPELLPPDETGAIRQKTEDILGPYALHDFFLYYFVKYRFRPAKIYYYACIAFAGELEPPFIKEKLALFYKRFCAGQFKRACAPDAASITEVNLCGVNYYIPSDLDPDFLLSELENVGLDA